MLVFNVPAQTAHGTLTEVGHGQYEYVPAPDYYGPDDFQFTATATGDPACGDQGWGHDGPLESAPATVDIDVIARFTRVGEGGIKKFTFPDDDEELTTVELRGPGYADVQVRNNQTGAAASGDIQRIVLNGTSEKSSLTVSTKGRGSDTTAGDIIVEDGSLRSLTAKTVDIVGDGITLTADGYIGSIRVRDICNGADIIMPGAGAAKGIRIKAGVLGQDTDIVLGSYLRSLAAIQ